MTNMNWNDLHYFVQLVREQTLTATADKLNVGHTTVARRIEALEQALDLPLFERVGKRYHLTEAGKRLYAQAVQVEENVFELERLAVGHDALAGSVTLSMPAGLAYERIAPHLSEFYHAYPNILLDIRNENHRSNLNKREADIALRVGRPSSNDNQDNLIIRKLGDIHYECYAHPHYLQTLDAHQNTDDSLSLRLVEFTGHQGVTAWAQQLKHQDEHDRIQPVFRSNDFYMVKRCIEQANGVGMLPDLLIDSLTDSLIGSLTDPMTDPLLSPQMQTNPTPPTHDGLTSLSTHWLASRYPALGERLSYELFLVIHSDVRDSAKIRAVVDWVYGVFDGVKALADGWKELAK